MTKQTLVITHDNCIDGFGCEALLKKQLKSTADYIQVNHHQYNFDSHYNESTSLWNTLNEYKNKRIIMADICLPKKWIDMLLSNGNHVSIIDHHQSAQHHLIDYIERKKTGEKIAIDILYDKENKQSGTMLTWKYIQGGHLLTPSDDYTDLLASPIDSPLIPNAVKYISDGDVWSFLHKETKGFYTYINNKRTNQEQDRHLVYNIIHNMNTQDLSAIVKEGTAQHLIYMDQVYSLMSLAKPIELFNIKGVIVEADSSFTSTLGNELAKKHNGFCLIVRESEDGSIKAGLRSIGDLDVCAIAIRFGGGGHKNASGFNLKNKQALNDVLNQHGNENFYHDIKTDNKRKPCP